MGEFSVYKKPIGFWRSVGSKVGKLFIKEDEKILSVEFKMS